MRSVVVALILILSLPSLVGAQCGGAFESCCPGNTCDPNLFCSGTLCVCGGLNEPCCNGTSCGNADLSCVAGTCQEGCGGPFEDCCAGNTCGPNLFCSGTLCVCGGLNEPCCNGTSCGNADLSCVAGTCQEGCGGPFEDCCAGNTCGPNLFCSGTLCVCGGLNEPCCNGTSCGNAQLTCCAATLRCSEDPCPPTPTVTPTTTPTRTPTATSTSTPRSNGAECGSSSECQSLFCVDGVCCNRSCAGPLELCNAPGSRGTCTQATAPAPALSRFGLLAGVAALVAISALALASRARSSHSK